MNCEHIKASCVSVNVVGGGAEVLVWRDHQRVVKGVRERPDTISHPLKSLKRF